MWDGLPISHMSTQRKLVRFITDTQCNVHVTDGLLELHAHACIEREKYGGRGCCSPPYGNLVVMCFQGHDSTLGFIKNINKPAAEDSVLVQVLRRQGAIPFVKTNVPQSLIR